MPGLGGYPNQSARITRAALTAKPEDGVLPALSEYFFGQHSSIQAMAGTSAGLASMAAAMNVLRPVAGAVFAGSWGAASLARTLRLTGFTSGAGITYGTSRLLRGLAGLATAGVDAAGVMRLTRALTAATLGAAALGARLVHVRVMIGAAHSGGVPFGRLAAVRSFAGRASGWSAIMWMIISAVRTIMARTVYARRDVRTLAIKSERRDLTVRREHRGITA